MTAFIHKPSDPEELIEKIVELANIARKEGMLALENSEIDNAFLDEGIKMLIDGNSARGREHGAEQGYAADNRAPYLGRQGIQRHGRRGSRPWA
jgi:hypothetical protein